MTSIELNPDLAVPGQATDVGDSSTPVSDGPAPFEYKALSSAAVSAFATGLLSCLALLDWWLALIPLVSIVLAIYALCLIRRRAGELTGAGFAKIAIVLAVLFLVTGWCRLGYIYATEVPEGYTRIGYAALQPEREISQQTTPQTAIALDGKKVFIKGYVYPGGSQRTGIRCFLLVRDKGDCCFGGDPKLTERIQVNLNSLEGMAYTTGICKIAGVFRIDLQQAAIDGPGGILYHLDEAVLR